MLHAVPQVLQSVATGWPVSAALCKSQRILVNLVCLRSDDILNAVILQALSNGVLGVSIHVSYSISEQYAADVGDQPTLCHH